jgi:fluoride exporter
LAKDERGIEDLPVSVDPDPSAAAEPSAGRSPARSRSGGRGGRRKPGILLAISGGAALGGPARYALAQLIHAGANGFPWATFWTNISGSFALGFILVILLERFPPSRYLRPFVATGFLGAYTTFSTFAVETDLLIKNGHPAVAAAYAGASLVVGVAAAWAGIMLARRVPVPRR